MGRAETMVTCPLTRGSMSMFRPVIGDMYLTTACRSDPWKLSTTSPARGLTTTAGALGIRAGSAGGANGSGDSAEGAPWGSVVCAEATCAASANAPARIRTAITGVFFMRVRRGPSAHIVVQRLVLALAHSRSLRTSLQIGRAHV